jgi:RND family efflux transporter MFP subunit
MKSNIYPVVLLAVVLASCFNKPVAEHQEELEESKLPYTAYSTDFELFAEADPFIAGETANVLSHFTRLPDFKAVERGTITICLAVNGKEVTQTLEKPTRKGIYSFDLKAETAGKGTLEFQISDGNRAFELIVPDITVYSSHDEAHKATGKAAISRTNTTIFTKEQSWKVDFATDYPKNEPFGQIIKTTAQVQSALGDETIVSAKMNGMVVITGNGTLEGEEVSKGQTLLFISGSELADNNMSVRYSEARNNLEKSKTDFDRATELAKDKIVSAKELLSLKNQYDNAKAIYDNLTINFSISGQNVTSPGSGYIKQLFVKNGTYVEAGQPIATISQNKRLILHAEVQQKYVPWLGSIVSANIRTVQDGQTFTLEQLNGKVLSFGKSANSDNYLIPVTFQIDNLGGLMAGGFVEMYIKTLTNTQALTVPNTSLLEEQGTFGVYVQVHPELFEKREVKIGATDGLRTEIKQGLGQQERIVTKGAILVKLAQATGTLDAHSGHVH